MKKGPYETSLDLPDAPEFISEPPPFTPWEMMKRCEAILPELNAKRKLLTPESLPQEPFSLDPVVAPKNPQ